MRRTEAGELRAIRDAELILEKIKSRQFSGLSNVLVQESETANTWDIDGTFSGQLVHNRLFIFTADTKKAPFVSFHPHIRVNNVDYDGTGAMRIDTFQTSRIVPGVDIERSVGFLVTLFDFDFSGPPAANYNIKVKMRCLSNDTGTIAVYTI